MWSATTRAGQVWHHEHRDPTPQTALELAVPEISRFFGIVIGMFYRDHEPAHFHASYGDHEITVAIEDGTVTGEFPPRALALVMEWYAQHRAELQQDWKLARAKQPLLRISPLE